MAFIVPPLTDPVQKILWDALVTYRKDQQAALDRHLVRLRELVQAADAARGVDVAFRKALTALCDEEYRFSLDCEAFGRVCEKLGIEEDPDEVAAGVDKIVDDLRTERDIDKVVVERKQSGRQCQSTCALSAGTSVFCQKREGHRGYHRGIRAQWGADGKRVPITEPRAVR